MLGATLQRPTELAFIYDIDELSAVGRACSRHRAVGSPTAAGGKAGSMSGSAGDSDPRAVPESSMRLAIFSDVHGQVGRLSACLEAVARTGADELWCLGDAIDGLSARPPELTVACVRAIDDVCTVKLAGNHEAWALQDESLPSAAADVIAGWGVAAQRDGVLAVHGSPHNPLMGRLSDERYVREALRRLSGWLCAHGHTHQAALWIGRGDGTIERQRRPTSQRLGRSMRAVACPGALSGPDPSWLLVDTVRRRLTWHRIDAGGPPPGAVSADRFTSSETHVHVSAGR
jgi:diadenosine tetraphosphatase ApaH/serine/threonine PP2A family protein phosphatase